MFDWEMPYRDELGFCNILICALGGDGANMAGKMLFKIGVEDLNLDGGYDARYGSEKKGTPTDVSVRFCKPGTPVAAVRPYRPAARARGFPCRSDRSAGVDARPKGKRAVHREYHALAGGDAERAAPAQRSDHLRRTPPELRPKSAVA